MAPVSPAERSRVAVRLGLSVALVVASLALLAAPARAQTWCLEHTECGTGWLCVGATCRPARDRSIVKLYPVAVSPFHDLTPDGRGESIVRQAPEILRGYLAASLFFDAVDERRTPGGASIEGWVPSSIDWGAWLDTGAYALIKGTVERVPGNAMVLDMRLYLIESGTRVQLKHDRQLVTDETMRRALGRWADDLLVEMTGRPGLFASRIAFAKRLGYEPKQVGHVGLDGLDEVPVTQNTAINMLPAWTRDATQVAYTSYIDGNPDLWVGGRKLSAYESLNSGASYSPDGKELALTLSMDGNAEIYVLDAETGEIKRRLTRSPSIDSSPSWSPDGQRIAFLSDRGGSPQIFVMDRDGNNQTRLPQVGGYNTSPDWSPVGSLVAYNTMVTATRFDIFLVDVDTGQTTRLTSGSGNNEEPSWSPDGRYITFTSTRDGGVKQVWIMSADGGLMTRVSRGASDYFTPAWSPLPSEPAAPVVEPTADPAATPPADPPTPDASGVFDVDGQRRGPVYSAGPIGGQGSLAE